jgi:predicted transcriptional regulator
MADPAPGRATGPARSTVLELTARIVAAHLAHNPVEAETVPGLIAEVYRTLSHIGDPAPARAERPQPAVPPRRSVFPDHIVCLEDGRKFKTLRRHLRSAYGMTPAQYRERWGLPPDYPMVAPDYARHRSSLAKKIGLGTRPRAAAAE